MLNEKIVGEIRQEGDVCFIIRSPTPPNFKSTPAKSIDPAVDASTWALGSHTWRRSMGVFIKKATDRDISMTGSTKFNGKIIWVLEKLSSEKNTILSRSGREPHNV